MSIDTAASARAKGGKAKTTALWVATGLLACLFVFSGFMKFVNPEMAEHFSQWGYPDWFRILIGVVELGGGLALLVPRTAWYAAGALEVVMAGAVFTHLRNGEVPQAVVPFVLLCVLAALGYARRP
jgi:uncharacterized membrane protein YphA (DoxX/SURF4 family)